MYRRINCDMVMSTSDVSQPESPLDVLSRAASMVESGQSESETEVSPPRSQGGVSRINSLKELHPKYRKHSATPEYMSQAESIRSRHGHERLCVTPPPPPYTLSIATSTTSSPEEAPLDFSIRKRSLSPGSQGPPPYKYSNPLRQHSPPVSRTSSSIASSISSSSSSRHLPVNPAPLYYRPPPYPRTPSPPPPPPPVPASAPSGSRPPPPSYEAAMASKPTSPRVSMTTSPTFMTLTTRPSPTIKTGSSEYSTSSSTMSPTKTDSNSRPSVICTGPSATREKKDDIAVNLFKKEEDKENDVSSDSHRSRKREVTIVEESGAIDLMEEHFRKSLGDDYKKVFQQPETKKDEESSMEVDPVKAFNDDLDMTGYTVDDHFAKALGDTWIKLQAEAAEKKEKKLPVGPSHKESKAQLLAL